MENKNFIIQLLIFFKNSTLKFQPSEYIASIIKRLPLFSMNNTNIYE